MTLANEKEKNQRIRDAAKRALAEADERRTQADSIKTDRPKEIKGRNGPEPARYGDWEKDGIASDF